MIRLTLRVMSLFTGSLLNTLVILGLFGAFYLSQHAPELQKIDREMAMAEISAALQNASAGMGKPAKVARKTAEPEIIRIQ